MQENKWIYQARATGQLATATRLTLLQLMLLKVNIINDKSC